jgi:hypothetical protein
MKFISDKADIELESKACYNLLSVNTLFISSTIVTGLTS